MRIIQVGLGPWGFDWARKILPSVDGVEVVARADGDADARARCAKALDEPRALYHPTLTDALSAAECDAVLATVPLAWHGAVVREALAADRHVLVEKPFVETVREAAELVALAESRGRVLMVSQNYRHFPAPLAVAEIVADGRFGALHGVEVDFRHNAGELGYRYYHLAQPMLSDMSIHHFDLMRMVLGAEPETVSCKTWGAEGTRFSGPPAAEATLEFAGGVTVQYAGSWISDDRPTPWAGVWRMVFDEAELSWTSRGSEGDRYARDRLVVRGDGVDESSQGLSPPAHLDRAGCLAAFRDAVETGAPPAHFSSGRDNVKSLAMVEASVRSSETGRTVAMSEVLA